MGCCDNCEPCDQWLARDCGFSVVTVTSCGVTTVFSSTKVHSVSTDQKSYGIAVHPSDCVFRVSRREVDVDILPGSVLVDDAGTEWQVYRVDYLRTFCVYKLWCRSVSACFTLLDKVDVIYKDCVDCDCSDEEEQWKIAGRAKGSVTAVSGQVESVNDSRNIRPRVICMLSKWPLKTLPKGNHRIQCKGVVYRILGFVNNGPMAPFELMLEE